MKIAAVIPSRYASSRFPGKPLARIAGITMIERVYRQAALAECFAEIIVATDDQRIADEVIRFGGKVETTDKSIKSGTERVWAVLAKSDFAAAVNIQGDEPLIAPDLIRGVAQALVREPIVSAARRSESYEDFRSPNVVKVVCGQDQRALYFSRAPIPWTPQETFTGFWQHIGIYGYTREMLETFHATPADELECRENLEQLRFLALGRPLFILDTDFVSHGVDVPGDVARIEALIRSQHG